MKHCGTQELTTERLVLRRMTTDDCEMMFGNWANDPEVTRYLRWEPHRDWVVTWWNQGYATEAAAAVRDYWFGMVGAPWLAGFHASQNVASSRVLAKTGFHYDHDTVLHRFDGTEVPCLAWYLLNPGSQKSDEPAATAPAVQAEPTEPAENAETTV